MGQRLACGDASKGMPQSLVHVVVVSPHAVVLLPMDLAWVTRSGIRGSPEVRSSAEAEPVRNQSGPTAISRASRKAVHSLLGSLRGVIDSLACLIRTANARDG